LKVTFSPKALDYAKREASYLGQYSQRAAREFRDNLKLLRTNLTRFPHMGHLSSELPVPGARRFVMGAYLVDYRITPTQIFVLAIKHGREGPTGIDMEEDFDFEDPPLDEFQDGQ
jgi:plasmid stabilization system protein ParE